jgi:Uma2 family endonuclease
MSAQIEPIMTVEDLDAMPEDGNRYEVIEGELFVSRAPTYIHQVVIGRLNRSLLNHLDNSPIGEALITPGLIFSQLDGVIPDMVYMSYERRNAILIDERLRAAPELVIEVVSPGAENIRRDRIAKRQLYAKYGVEEYWVIDPQTCSIEVYRLRGVILDLVAMHTGKQLVETPLLPGWSITADELFVI